MDTEALQEILVEYTETIIDFLPRLALCVVIFLIGSAVIKKILSFANKTIEHSKISQNVKPFFKSFLSISLKAILFFVILAIIGVKTAGLMTLIAALGFGIAMALQGSLGNLAAGLLIMIFRPYKMGDFINVGDHSGTVKEIQLLNTIITNLDNKDVIIPNGSAISENVTNSSSNGYVRLDFTVYMPYNESFPKVQKLLLDALEQTELILNDPQPQIGILEFDTHSIKLSVKPFCLVQHMEPAYYNATETVKKALGEGMIKVAYSEGVELGEIGK
ncbi:mechanosensitive ion channel family protein [Portibacter lacus]|uniref:Transporter n=1 Tax=Portibacter lacus TaxID=1099794 RepID=A0AA37SN77_9BACT|nr:mechanosensitive ion channel family protein [Portibacter lacus]GLR16134.1 transporter [Portibacter lacus]